jgi:hypothetical protein
MLFFRHWSCNNQPDARVILLCIIVWCSATPSTTVRSGVNIFLNLVLIGCTNLRADLGIPRTQAARSGSGLGAHRRPSSRATARDYFSATPTLRRRSTPPPPPSRPAARPGSVPPGSGHHWTRSGREQASVTAPSRTAGTGAARTGQLSAPDWTVLLSILRRASNTGRRASPVRSGPWRIPGLPAGGASSGCWHAAADQWIAQSVSVLGSGLQPVHLRELRLLWGRRARFARHET